MIPGRRPTFSDSGGMAVPPFESQVCRPTVTLGRPGAGSCLSESRLGLRRLTPTRRMLISASESPSGTLGYHRHALLLRPLRHRVDHRDIRSESAAQAPDAHPWTEGTWQLKSGQGD
jgi:hypothetical protein